MSVRYLPSGIAAPENRIHVCFVLCHTHGQNLSSVSGVYIIPILENREIRGGNDSVWLCSSQFKILPCGSSVLMGIVLAFTDSDKEPVAIRKLSSFFTVLNISLVYTFFLGNLTLLLLFLALVSCVSTYSIPFTLLSSLYWQRATDGFQCLGISSTQTCPDLNHHLPGFPSSYSHSQFVVSENHCCQRGCSGPLLGLCHLFFRPSSLPSSTSVFCSFVFSKLCSVPIASVSICDRLLFLLFADFCLFFP